MNEEEEQNQPDPSQGVTSSDYSLDAMAAMFTPIKGAVGVGRTLNMIKDIINKRKPASEQTVDVTSEPSTNLYEMAKSDASKNFLGKLKKRMLDSDLGQIYKVVKKGELIMDFTAGGNRTPSDKDFEQALEAKKLRDQEAIDAVDKENQALYDEVTKGNELLQNKDKQLELDLEGDIPFKDLLTDPALADKFPKIRRAFYSKRKPDTKGRLYDLQTGRFSLAELRLQYPGAVNQNFRREIQTLAADPRFSKRDFNVGGKALIDQWLDGLDGVADKVNLEVHHVRTVRYVGALFDGLDVNERAILLNELLDNMFPVGDNPDNLMPLEKGVHKNLHDRLNKEIGKYAEKYIDKNVRYTIDEKVAIAKRMGKVINELTNEAYDAMAVVMEEKVAEVSPAAKADANYTITEQEANEALDFIFEQIEKQNQRNIRGFESIQRRMSTIDEVTGDPLPYQYEDQSPSEILRQERLLRRKKVKNPDQLELNIPLNEQ